MSALTKSQVLALLKKKKRALHVGELAGRFRIKGRAQDKLSALLAELVSGGAVRELPGGRFQASSSEEPKEASKKGNTRADRPPRSDRPPRGERSARSDRTPRGERNARSERTSRGRPRSGNPQVGRLSMHPSGFGFVAPELGGDDVFIPPSALEGAVHGDRVEIVSRKSSKGREGEVTGIVQRGVSKLTGTLRRDGRRHVFHPDNPRLPGPLTIDGEVPDGVSAESTVLARWTEYPDRNATGKVEITAALGATGLTTVEVEKLKIRDGVEETFHRSVLREASEWGDKLRPADRKGREDLRNIDLCTIDPVDARDHDDALWVKREKDGAFRAVIAIADVSHYVPPGSKLDEAAQERGCSIYLPDRAIPMLPEALSSNLASLVPKKDRLCLALDVTVGPQGGVRRYRLIEGLMRSGAALTYEGVAQALGLSDEQKRQPAAHQRIETLQALLELSKILRQKRLRRGALDFDLPEGRVSFSDSGEPSGVYRTKADPGVKQAYRMVEELMLLANEVIAKDLADKNVPAIYRVHGAPDDKKLEKFCELANALGHPIDADDAKDPRRLSTFLRRIEGTPHSAPLSMLLLRAMQQAVYDTTNIGHFGLGAKHYLHFTSPIRRYPDLEVHRIARALARSGNEAMVDDADGRDETEQRAKLQRSAVESSHLERRATGLERDVVSLYRAVLMRDHIGEQFRGTISGISPYGFYSTLDDPFLDTFTPIASLGSEIEVDRLGIRLSARRGGAQWALGDVVELRIEEVSLERREVVATCIGDPVSSGMFGSVPAEFEETKPSRHPRSSDRDNRRGPGKRGPAKRGQGRKPRKRKDDDSERRPRARSERKTKGRDQSSPAREKSKRRRKR